MTLLNKERLLREVKCIDCHEKYKSDEPVPICPYCGGQAVSLVISALTGKHITGEK